MGPGNQRTRPSSSAEGYNHTHQENNEKRSEKVGKINETTGAPMLETESATRLFRDMGTMSIGRGW